MNAILLSGYRQVDENEAPLGTGLIDKRIYELQSLGLNVICVLAGHDADDLLRASRRLMSAELVFDTQDNPNLATNLKAGLAATEGEGSFVLPVEMPAPPPPVWWTLREEWRKVGFHTAHSCLQLRDGQGAPLHYGFPLLVTRAGNALIRESKDFRTLVDTRLKYLHLELNPHGNLASAEKPL